KLLRRARGAFLLRFSERHPGKLVISRAYHVSSTSCGSCRLFPGGAWCRSHGVLCWPNYSLGDCRAQRWRVLLRSLPRIVTDQWFSVPSLCFLCDATSVLPNPYLPSRAHTARADPVLFPVRRASTTFQKHTQYTQTKTAERLETSAATRVSLHLHHRFSLCPGE
ncbi:unnamed protein product, partial [Ectocarpus sp. 8 AP-2014]